MPRRKRAKLNWGQYAKGHRRNKKKVPEQLNQITPNVSQNKRKGHNKNKKKVPEQINQITPNVSQNKEMDSEDPIHQLLKNTGWSCDELLERLQKLKSTGTEPSTDEQLPSQSNSALQKDSFHQNEALLIKETTTDVTSSLKIEQQRDSFHQNEALLIKETTTDVTSSLKIEQQRDLFHQNEALLIKETTTDVTSSLKIEQQRDSLHQNEALLEEDTTPDVTSFLKIQQNEVTQPEVSNIEDSKDPDSTLNPKNDSSVTVTICDSTKKDAVTDTICDSTKKNALVDSTFSDTDEEEMEVNTTNSLIINEIIEDIAITSSQKPDPILPIADDVNGTSNEKPEITEVRVIEVNDNENYIEDTDNDNTIKPKETENQQGTNRRETITTDTKPTEKKPKDGGENIEYVEIHPRKRYENSPKHSTELKEKSLPINLKLVKKLPLSPQKTIPKRNSLTVPNSLSTLLLKGKDSQISQNSQISQMPQISQNSQVYQNSQILQNPQAPRLVPQKKIVHVRKIRKLPHPRPVYPNKKFEIDPTTNKLYKRYTHQEIGGKIYRTYEKVLMPSDSRKKHTVSLLTTRVLKPNPEYKDIEIPQEKNPDDITKIQGGMTKSRERLPYVPIIKQIVSTHKMFSIQDQSEIPSTSRVSNNLYFNVPMKEKSDIPISKRKLLLPSEIKTENDEHSKSFLPLPTPAKYTLMPILQDQSEIPTTSRLLNNMHLNVSTKETSDIPISICDLLSPSEIKTEVDKNSKSLFPLPTSSKYTIEPVLQEQSEIPTTSRLFNMDVSANEKSDIPISKCNLLSASEAEKVDKISKSLFPLPISSKYTLKPILQDPYPIKYNNEDKTVSMSKAIDEPPSEDLMKTGVEACKTPSYLTVKKQSHLFKTTPVLKKHFEPLLLPKEPNTSHVEISQASSHVETSQASSQVETSQASSHVETSQASSHVETSDDEMDSSSNLQNLEDLRNSLKLQLDSLRKRKKNTFMPISSTKLVDNNFECGKKLNLLDTKEVPNEETKVKETTSTPLEANKGDTEISEETEHSENINNNLQESERKSIDFCEEYSTVSSKSTEVNEIDDSELFVQTNEVSFVIADVQGGVQLDDLIEDTQKSDSFIEETDPLNLDSSNSSAANETEDNGVFDLIRKIINKHKSSNLKDLNQSVSSQKTPVKNTSTKNDENKKMDISTLSGDNSQSSSSEPTGTEEKSPFVSNSLDEFLTASQLNISYQVPKLGAEDGFQQISEERRKNFLIEPLPPLILKKVETVKNIPSKEKGSTIMIKAKTVAQKRRILERERRKEIKRLEKTTKKDAEMEEVKSKEEIILKPKLKRDLKDSSYVLFNNTKIWVNSAYPNKCIAQIDCNKDKLSNLKSPQRKKWSLLNSPPKKNCDVRYRPGPLSQKHKLQMSGCDKWESRLLKLPQILLEVTPEVKKPFCNDVLHRFASVIGGELDSNKIEFALSMVQPRNNDVKEKPTCYQFPLQYHNKIENTLVRQKKLLATEQNTVKNDKSEVKISKDPVADVIEALINYVEIKEIAPSLIKEDETQEKVEEKPDKVLAPVTENNVSVFRKPQRKRSKVEYELLRLSCKVVNVEVEESKEDICKKPYCELGCVCKSIKCEYVPTNHCQKVACMFECTCPEGRPLVYDNITLPAGTNILSEDAVNRIEGEAKKNLAKVEREFTQTVIHTSDKTIVVGIGNRTKTRRCAKIPAKFSDFITSTDAVREEEKLSAKCVVSLPKIDLSGIIPYCLTHALYDCYCKGQALWQPKSTNSLDLTHNQTFTKGEAKKCSTDKIVEYNDGQNLKRKRYTFETKETEAESAAKKQKQETDQSSNLPNNVDSDSSSNSSDGWSPTKRPIRNIKKPSFSKDYVEYRRQSLPECRRVRPVCKKYLKSYKYTKEIFKDDFICNVNDSDLLKIKLQQTNPGRELSEADLLKQLLINNKMADQLKQTQKNKRKQILMLRNDETLTPPVKIVEESKNSNEDQRRKKVPVTQSQTIVPVFEGEIIINDQNMELLSKMGPKTVADGYARLLPWVALMNGFHNNTINIWSMINQPSRLLINKSDKRCPKSYINIKDTRQMTEVITWILKNRLPSHYQEDSLSFILKETKDNYEICGICTKNITDDLDQQQTKRARVTSTQNNDEEDKEPFEIFCHKDLNGVEQKLVLTTEKKLSLTDEIRLNSVGDTTDKDKVSILARLPNVLGKWRMLCLNSDFTYIVLKSAQYSIRYTDLLAISQYAQKRGCVLSLRNEFLQHNYSHDLFGIYFDGKCGNRVFIGPYKRNLKDDVETLRYINKTLVSTENFNRMRGKSNYQVGVWLVQCDNNVIMDSSGTIDLTSESESPNTVNATSKTSLYPHSPLIIYKDSEIKIIDALPRKPEDFNRYIITNIPHFGYLGAFRHLNAEIDVSWPFENKLLRFKNESYAVTFLQERFAILLQSVPETFKITIIVATNIDLKLYKPIDSSVLNGLFICGEFGYYKVMPMSDAECREKVGYPKEEILKLFAKRAQTFIKKRIEELANILEIPRVNNRYELDEIIDKTHEEILGQKAREFNNMEIKKRLTFKKRENIMKLYKILLTLPPEQRNIENLKFRSILNQSEAIEIPDSDDESNKSDQGNKDQSLEVVSDETTPATSGVKKPATSGVAKPATSGVTKPATSNSSSKMFKTPKPLRGLRTLRPKLQSVLKPLVSVPVDRSTSYLLRGEVPSSTLDSKFKIPSPSHFVKGVKLIKTPLGFKIVEGAPVDLHHSSLTKKLSPLTSVLNAAPKSSSPMSSLMPSSSSGINSNVVFASKTNTSPSPSFGRIIVSNLTDDDTYNPDDVIDLDNDEDNANSDVMTELHIVGDKLVKKVINKCLVKNISDLKETVNCDKNEDAGSERMEVDLVETPRTATVTKVTEKRPNPDDDEIEEVKTTEVIIDLLDSDEEFTEETSSKSASSQDSEQSEQGSKEMDVSVEGDENSNGEKSETDVLYIR